MPKMFDWSNINDDCFELTDVDNDTPAVAKQPYFSKSFHELSLRSFNIPKKAVPHSR